MLLAALFLPLPSSLVPLPSAHAAEPPADTKGDAAALAAAKQLLADQQYRAAAKAYEAANDHAGGHCGECLLGLAGARLGLGDLDAATVATQDAVGALAGDPLQGIAYLHLGEIFLRRAGACRPPPCGPAAVAELTAAGEAFEKALASGSVDRASALTGLATSRFRRSLYPQAAEAAQAALTAAGGGPAAAPARVVLCRARAAAGLPAAHPPGAESGTPPTLHLEGEVKKPIKISTPPPVYPEEARKQLITGVVTIESIIDREGCVSGAHVLQGLPAGLDAAALLAVRNWVFEPATLAGRPVRVFYTLTVNFQIDLSPSRPRLP